MAQTKGMLCGHTVGALLLASAGIAFGQGFATTAAAQDARSIVVRAVAAYERTDALARNYTYKARSEVFDLNSAGKTKAAHARTYEVLPIGGKSYLRLLEKDDRPIPNAEAEKERAKLDREAAAASRLTEAEHRKVVENAERERTKRRAQFKDIPDAYDFKLVGEEEISGRGAYMIRATPLPAYKGSFKGILHNVEGTLWIDKLDFHWIKLDLDVLHAFSLGLFLARVGEGTHLTYEMMRVNDELWAPKQITLKASARLLLLKKINADQHVTFFDYRKFQTDSRVVSTEPAP